MNFDKKYTGFCIEFKNPTNNYQISEAQLEMKSQYKHNGYKFLISNDYDKIIAYLNRYGNISKTNVRATIFIWWNQIYVKKYIYIYIYIYIYGIYMLRSVSI